MVVGAYGPEGSADVAACVGDQPELEVLTLAESLLRLGGVVGDAENLCAGLVEL